MSNDGSELLEYLSSNHKATRCTVCLTLPQDILDAVNTALYLHKGSQSGILRWLGEKKGIFLTRAAIRHHYEAKHGAKRARELNGGSAKARTPNGCKRTKKAGSEIQG